MLDRVTITGADDKTPISALADMSAEFPFAEWGILVSASREGTPRYPSRDWCERLSREVWEESHIRTSMHVCGAWARRIFAGEKWQSLVPPVSITARRIQVNGIPKDGAHDYSALDIKGKQFIFQSTRADGFAFGARCAGFDVCHLVDDSGGHGVERTSWPRPYSAYTGYAGGIGPGNVAKVLRDLFVTCGAIPFWIDMEGRVRDENDNLDLGKVRDVLAQAAKAIEGE